MEEISMLLQISTSILSFPGKEENEQMSSNWAELSFFYGLTLRFLLDVRYKQ